MSAVITQEQEQAIAQEIIAKAGDPVAAMAEIETHFTILWKAAPDEKYAKVLENTWGLVQQVNHALGESFALLVAARALVSEVQHQNKTMLDLQEKIIRDLNDPLTVGVHPLVEACVEFVQDEERATALQHFEAVFEGWKESEFERLSDDALEYAEESIVDEYGIEIGDTLDMSSFEGYDVLELLRGEEGALTDGEISKFKDWLFEVRTRIEADRKKRREAIKPLQDKAS